MNIKKEIEIDIKDQDVTKYIKELKQDLLNIELENCNIFGDFELAKKARQFNSLEEWQKNLYCLYIYAGSYKNMEKYLNVKVGTIQSTLKDIKSKVTK